MGYTLNCIASVPARPFNVEQVRGCLRHLWEHGLRFDPHGQDAASWEEQLHSAQISVLTSNGQTSGTPLADALNAAATDGHLTLEMWDHGLELTLSFDPLEPTHRPQNQMTLGTVSMTATGRFATTSNIGDPSALIPEFLQVWAAFLHWSAVLCDALKPLFAVIFSEGYMLKDENFYWTGRAAIEHALQHHKVPALDQWLEGGGVRYLPPDLATPATVQSLLQQPDTQVTRLAGGGLFVVPPLNPFRYEHGIAYRLAAQAQEAEQQGTAEQTIVHAQTIMRAIGDKKGELLVIPSERAMPNADDVRQAMRELGMDVPGA